MHPADRGPLLYVYVPIPANPMSVAILLLLVVVTFVLGPLVAASQGLWPLGGLCFVPLAAILLWILVNRPSPTLVFEEGIEASLPLWRRLGGAAAYAPWADIRDVYPASYEVAGSFLSPFASSAGTLVHTGLAIETRAGRRILVRFTPGAIRAFRSESPAFQQVLETVRARFARAGQPMVTTARAFTDEEVLRLTEEARRPLVSIATVFLAFFLPPALVAAILIVATALGIPITPAVAGAAVAAAVVPPAASMASTLRRSDRRNGILSELAKYQESRRGGEMAAGSPPA